MRGWSVLGSVLIGSSVFIDLSSWLAGQTQEKLTCIISPQRIPKDRHITGPGTVVRGNAGKRRVEQVVR